MLLFSACGFSQTVTPVPADPLELATGPVQVADTPEKRAAALGLLEVARQNHNLHLMGGPAFTLKASFESLGASAYAGQGTLEETWINGRRWRWTTEIGDYSQLRIFLKGAAYDQKPGAGMPMRVQMVRSAVFWPMIGNLPHALIRTAATNWNGREVTCMLISGAGSDATPTPGRRWEETEYCIEPKSGLLQTYSFAPGLYTAYDYNNGLPFHGRTLPREISTVEGGQTVLRIRVESIGDPGKLDANFLTPTEEMLAGGPGGMISGAYRFRQQTPGPAGYGGAVQPVVVNAILDEDGKVLDAEPLQTRDPKLTEAALELVRRTQYPPAGPGMRSQREAFINVRFMPQQ